MTTMMARVVWMMVIDGDCSGPMVLLMVVWWLMVVRN